jgi:spore germination protein GerM
VRLAWVLATLVALTAGCGLSTNDEPERIDSESMAEEAAGSGSTAAATGAASSGSGTQTVQVWFIRNSDDGNPHLVAVNRHVTNADSAEQRLLALIQEPPTGAGDEDDLVSYVSEDTELIDVEVQTNGVLTVELSDNFYDQQGGGARLAFAQVVFTATEMDDGIERVRFASESEGSQPVDGEGQTRDGPLGREAYRNLDIDDSETGS